MPPPPKSNGAESIGWFTLYQARFVKVGAFVLQLIRCAGKSTELTESSFEQAHQARRKMLIFDWDVWPEPDFV